MMGIGRRWITRAAVAVLGLAFAAAIGPAPAQAAGPACYQRDYMRLQNTSWTDAEVYVYECTEYSSHWYEFRGWVKDTDCDGLTAYLDIWNSYHGNEKATYVADGCGRVTRFTYIFSASPYGLYARTRACSWIAGCSPQKSDSYYA